MPNFDKELNSMLVRWAALRKTDETLRHSRHLFPTKEHQALIRNLNVELIDLEDRLIAGTVGKSS